MMLPYITTPLALAKREGQELVRWRPEAEPDLVVRREIWMPETLVKQINSWPLISGENEKKSALRRLDTQAFLAAFLLGHDQEVGVKDDRCDLKALTPPPGQDWEAWEMRVTPASPHTRIFGVFVSPTDFIAMSCYAKSELNGAAQTNEANKAKNQAKTLVGQSIISISGKLRPCSRHLGGEDYGYYDTQE